MDTLDLFCLAMKRTVNPFHLDLAQRVLNLGPGESHIPGAAELEWPEWNAETDAFPYPDHAMDTVLGFHFLEHLTSHGVINVLRETERVLKVGGNAIFMVPHASQAMAWQDLDHKTLYTEDSFRNLFANVYYEKMRVKPWRMSVQSTLIMGVVIRNLALFVQLRKEV